MPSCCVPLCTNGYASEQRERKASGRPNPSFFKIKPEQLQKWNRAIPRQDRPLTVKDSVCSDHFHDSDIERYFPDIIIGNQTIKGELRKKPLLKPDAVPSIFQGPSYLNIPETKKRRAPVDRGPPAKHKKDSESQQNDNQNGSSREGNSTTHMTNMSKQDDTIKLPDQNWCIHSTPEQIRYMKLNANGTVVTHVVQRSLETNEVLVKVRGCTIPVEDKVLSTTEAQNRLLRRVDMLKVCAGNGFGGNYSSKCAGGISKGIRCKACRASRKAEVKRLKRVQNASKRKELIKKRNKCFHKIRKQNIKMKQQIKSLKAELKDAYKMCQKMKKSQLEEKIKDFPDVQKLAVHAILDAAKRKGPHGNRYEAEWIYETMLMRIKSPALYEHIRDRKIMPLPSRTTLNRYMRNLKAQYGFQPALFEVLKHKLSSMPEEDRHGNIIIDEMKIPVGLSLDRNSLEVIGLVDIGKFTPDSEKNKPGDHILEVLFQPFRGRGFKV